MERNVTLLNLNVLDISENLSDELEMLNISDEQMFSFSDAFSKESEKLLVYNMVGWILGTSIILSNMIVVVSSGLIIKKGQQPKSTYLLLGNVSLADTIIGVCIISNNIVKGATTSLPLCIFQIGLFVCPTLVSIFSVGLIAVDRYIYILHGLYYQRWFNTTRVRIGIVCTWITGIILAFLPATGWINKYTPNSKCYYFSVHPKELILLNATLSIVPVVVVLILYSIILIHALRNVRALKNLKSPTNIKNVSKFRTLDKSQNNQYVNKAFSTKINKDDVKKTFKGSSSATELNSNNNFAKNKISVISKSVPCLYGNSDLERNIETYKQICESMADADSKISVVTLTTTTEDLNSTSSINKDITCKTPSFIPRKVCKMKDKSKPSEWRAITVVLLTSGSFVLTWTPFCILIMIYVLCENNEVDPKCLHIKYVLVGPMASSAYFNSLLNPIIYAWWHKGFKRAVKKYWTKQCSCFRKQ